MKHDGRIDGAMFDLNIKKTLIEKEREKRFGMSVCQNISITALMCIVAWWPSSLKIHDVFAGDKMINTRQNLPKSRSLRSRVTFC